MLKELLSHRPIQVALVFVILIGISSVLYLNHVKTQTEANTANTETRVFSRETLPASPPDTPDASTQGGHRHADGTWHEEADETSEKPVSDSKMSVVEVLEKYPHAYEILSPESQRQAQEVVKLHKTLEELRAGNEKLERLIAEQEASRKLAEYLETQVEYVQRVYPDYLVFMNKYPDPQFEDFVKEYPDVSKREAFMRRFLAVSVIYKEMADRTLETPGAEENLGPEMMAQLVQWSSLGKLAEAALAEGGVGE